LNKEVLNSSKKGDKDRTEISIFRAQKISIDKTHKKINSIFTNSITKALNASIPATSTTPLFTAFYICFCSKLHANVERKSD